MEKKYFDLIHECPDTKARAGVVHTDHGDIPTPIFMPVGTQATVKAMEQRELVELDAKIILGNTYHLYLRPGTDVISHFGGQHKFMNWDRPILTDSGGYQVFSLKELRKISDKGVEFRSHIDGSKHFFSPASVVEIQRILGSDIIMPLDECVPYPSDEKYTAKSNILTLKWAREGREAFLNSSPRYGHTQYQHCITQGGTFANLRREFALEAVEYDFDGYSIGGLSVGEPAEVMYDLTDLTTDILPKDKPRYLMGVGTPENILESIERGVDMFDCVLPTRNARNGTLFTTRGRVNIRNAKYKLSERPIDENLDCYASQNFTLGYLRHLFVAKEILALQLATQQNIAFYLWLVRTAREKIINNEYKNWKAKFLDNYLSEND